MVRIDAGQRMILASDATSQALDFLDGSGRHLGSLPLGNIAVSLAESGRHWYIGAIGHFGSTATPLRCDRSPSSPASRDWLMWLPATSMGMVERI